MESREDLEYEFVNIGEFDTIEEIPIPLRTSLTGTIMSNSNSSNSSPGDLVSIGSNSKTSEHVADSNGGVGKQNVEEKAQEKTLSLSADSDLAASLISDGNHHMNGFGSNSSSASASQDDEILRKLMVIQSENGELKSMLDTYKNNTKKAFEQVEDYKTKFSDQLAKLEETLQILDNLKEENTKLKQTSYGVASLKDEINRLNNELENNCRGKIDRLESVRIESQFESLTNKIDSKNIELESARIKISEIQHLYEETKKANATLREHIAFQQEEATKYAVCASLLDEKEREMNKMKAEIDRLSLMSGQASVVYSKLSEYEEALKNVNNENELLRKRETSIVEEEKQRNTYFVALREEKERELDRLKQEFENYKKIATNINSTLKDENESLKEKTIALEKSGSMSGECCAKKDEDIRNMRKSYEKAVASIERLDEAVNGAERENASLKLRLSNYEKEHGSYNVRIALLVEENNSVKAYKAQMDLYKADFEAEKKSKEELNKERVSLQQEIIRLKDDLKKKNDELEALHRTHLQLATEHVDRPNASVPPTNSNTSTPSSSTTPLHTTLTSGFANFFNYVKRELNEIGNDGPEGAAGGDSNAPTANSLQQSSNASSISSSNVNEGEEREVNSGEGKCPICSKEFTNIHSLQTHASTCGTGFEEFYHIERSDPFVFP